MDSKEIIKQCRILLGMEKAEEVVETPAETPEVVEVVKPVVETELVEVAPEVAPTEEVPTEDAPEAIDPEETKKEIEDLKMKYDELLTIVQQIVEKVNMTDQKFEKVLEQPTDLPVHLKKSTSVDKNYEETKQKLVNAFRFNL